MRELVFRTVNIAIDESNFHDRIGQVPRANMLQDRCEKFALLRRDDVGNDNDDAGVERFFAMQIKKVGAIVGDKGVLLLADDLHQLPILQAAETAMRDVVSRVAR
jgi:hypothetical protein